MKAAKTKKKNLSYDSEDEDDVEEEVDFNSTMKDGHEVNNMNNNTTQHSLAWFYLLNK